MKGATRFSLGLLILIITAFSAQSALAQSGQPVSDDDVNEVAKGLYCPVCENISLDVCPTPACTQWRELIRDKLSLGWSKKQIEDYFVQQYGDRVLAVPPKNGINRLIYVIPPVVIIGGIVLVFIMIQRGKKLSIPAESAVFNKHSELSKSYLKKIEQDLRKEDES
ncbi:MAG: hypothetical protein C0401_08025 [Anaerolinea sp.]|nr:hypothetical protein [Anaerolinea sp.]